MSRPEDPAALADVAALVDLIGSFLPAVGTTGGPARRLWAAVDTARHRTPTARRWVDDLAALLGEGGTARRTGRRGRRTPTRRRGRRSPERRSATPRPRHARPHPRTPAVGTAARLAVSALAALVLWRLGPAVSDAALAPAIRLAATVLRWAALAAATYGVVVSSVTLAAIVCRSHRLAATAGRLGPPLLRRWATGITSFGLLGAALASASGTSTAARMTSVEAPPRPSAPATDVTSTSTTTTTSPSIPTTSATVTPTVTAPRPEAPAVPSEPATWTAARGDDLWHIAAHTLEARWNRAPTNVEIADYWQRLVASNVDRLRNRDDPDLIFPGQVFDLPPVDPPGA